MRRLIIIDGSDPQTDALILALNQAGYICQLFSDRIEFLKKLRSHACDVVIATFTMLDQEGLEFLAMVRRLRPELPVVVVCSAARVPLAVQVMKSGAADFIDRQALDNLAIVARINTIFSQAEVCEEDMPSDFTIMEKVVLRHVLLGMKNGQTARKLGLSVRTVEDHRGSATKKLGVSDPVELVKRCVALGILKIDARSPARASEFTSVQSIHR